MSWDPVWEKFSQERERINYPSDMIIRLFAKHFYNSSDRSAIKVLEVGCGTGANLWYLGREGFAGYGIDGSESAIRKAREWVGAEGYTPTLVVGDISHLSQYYPPNSFDCVLDSACLQCNRSSDVQAIVRQIREVLKPGGWFFSLAMATGSYGEGMGQEIEPGTWAEVPEGPLKDRGISHFFTLEEMEMLLGPFEEVNIEYHQRSIHQRRDIYKSWIAEARKPAG